MTSTETTPAAVTPENSAGNAPEPVALPVIPGMAPEFVEQMLNALRSQIEKHNNLAETIKNTGDRVALKEQYFENPDSLNNPDAINAVKWVKDLEEQLEVAHKSAMELMEPIIQEALKRSGVEQKQEEADALATQVKATTNYLATFGVPLDSIPALEGRPNRGTRTTGAGAGTPKYRNLEVYVGDSPDALTLASQEIVTTKDGKKTTRIASNLTYGAKNANVTNEVFRKAFLDAAGTTDPDKFPERTEFTVKDLNDKLHYCVVKKVPAAVA